MNDRPFLLLDKDLELLSTESRRSIRDAIKEYIEWRGGFEQLPALTINDREVIKEAIRRQIITDYGLAQLQEIEAYLNQVTNCSSNSRANKIKRPSGYRPLAQGAEDDTHQRNYRRHISNLLALHASEIDFKLSWLDSANYEFVKSADCPICGRNAKMTFVSDSEWSFACSSCGHELVKPLNEDNNRCTCIACSDMRGALVQHVRNVIRSEASTLKARMELVNALLNRNNEPALNEKQMLRDYELNKNNIDKSLRAIISLRPTTPEDFVNCADLYSASTGENLELLYDKARKYKLIYERSSKCLFDTRNITDRDIVSLLRENANLSFYRVGKNARIIHAFWVGPEDENAGCNEIMAEVFRLIFDVYTGTAAEYIAVDERGHLNVMLPPITTTEAQVNGLRARLFSSDFGLDHASIDIKQSTTIILNQFFFNPPAKNRSASTSEHALPLLKSKTEARAYMRIKEENPESIVIPNRYVRQIIDLKKQKHLHSERDYNYLWTCEVDFVIYDTEGKVIFVEEIQRGDHHNEPSWVKKDHLKRLAFEYAGVMFVESF